MLPIQQTLRLVLVLLLAVPTAALAGQDATRPTTRGAATKPGQGLLSRFAQDMDPSNPLPEYPRPQMARPDWINLNGQWDYAVTPEDAPKPERFEGKIVVPFAIESALSGVQQPLRPGQRLWYRRTFEKPSLEDKRLLLHFGAVDWHAEVFVNGQSVGDHKGGYDPFSFDITGHLRDGANELVVAVLDPTTDGTQPVGKQRLKPEGIWYTPVSGIWQTVWLEPVPASAIAGLEILPDIDAGEVEVRVRTARVGEGPHPNQYEYTILEEDRVIARVVLPTATARIKVPEMKLWSPDSPHLYGLTVGYGTDTVESYFGMRKISLSSPAEGEPVRLLLNNEPVFMFGLLDQGWWPDGLYTAPSDEALRYDIEVTRQMGFNTARKHVKVEPARWYYWADKLGLLVWQDMPSNFATNARPDAPEDPEMDRGAAEQWLREWRAILDTLRNHPSIVVWVPFNEGWGQHETNGILAWTKQYDPSRLVGGPSGWADRGAGDLHDMHSYPGPGMFPPSPGRASVLGEFGGLGLPLPGHLWQENRNWGYRTFKTTQELQRRYEQLIVELRPLIRQGLSAAIYTQTTDVEGEVNGLVTYDRKVVKLDPTWLAELHAPLYAPVVPAERVELLPTSELKPRPWSYTLAAPPENWMQPAFPDHAWQTGFGGFGRKQTPGAMVRTEWTGSDIWLRQRFTLEEGEFHEPHLRIHHDEDVTVYLNGRKIAELEGFSTSYRDIPLSKEAAAALRRGDNVIAVHCRQTEGGQYIDVGLIDLKPRQ